MGEIGSFEWLSQQKPTIHTVEVQGKEFLMRQPTVRDRDRFDALVAKMDMGAARLRTPLLQGLLCDQTGQLIAADADFDDVPAELVEPLVDKARELYGITDSPTDGGTD